MINIQRISALRVFKQITALDEVDRLDTIVSRAMEEAAIDDLCSANVVLEFTTEIMYDQYVHYLRHLGLHVKTVSLFNRTITVSWAWVELC